MSPFIKAKFKGVFKKTKSHHVGNFVHSDFDWEYIEITDLNTQKLALQSKLQSATRQKEEADEIAAANLSKLRKAQADVKDANRRADAAESVSQRRNPRRHF